MQDCSVLKVNSAGVLLARYDYSGYTNGYGCLTSGLAVDNNNHLWVTSRTDPGFVFRIDPDSGGVIAVVRPYCCSALHRAVRTNKCALVCPRNGFTPFPKSRVCSGDAS
jgi:hypothetical protein